jgi:hypothetical protein
MVLTAAPLATGDPEESAPRPGQVVTVAGVEGKPGYSGDGGDARQARLGSTLDIAVAPNGVLYLADRSYLVLRAVDPEGVINTVPGAHDSNDFSPVAVAFDAAGVLYVGLGSSVVRMNPDGTFTRIAGGGRKRFDDDGTGDGGDGGPATDALLQVRDIAVGPAGSVYVLDNTAGRLRRVAPDGTITTIARWDRNPAALGDSGVAVGRDGTVYFVREGFRGVQKVVPGGAVSTVLGQQTRPGFAGDGGPAAKAQFERASSIATDADGNLYVADRGNQNIRVVDEKGVVNSVAPYVRELSDVAVGPAGDLYVTTDSQIKRLTPGTAEVPPTGGKALKPGAARWLDQEPGTVVPIAGTGRKLTGAQRYDSWHAIMAVGPDGTVFVSDTVNSSNEVTAIHPDGKREHYAGANDNYDVSGDGGPATAAGLGSVDALAADKAGNLYISGQYENRIRKVDSAGTITTVAGTGADVSLADDVLLGDGGPATSAAVEPTALAAGPDGSLYVADDLGGSRIRKIDPNGVITSIVGGGETAIDDTTNPAEVNLSNAPTALAVGADGSVYFNTTYSDRLYVLSPGGTVSPVTADGTGFAGDGGPAGQALLHRPQGLAVGPDGTRYVADTFNNRLRAVGPDGIMTTVAGTGKREDDGDGGPAADASLVEPEQVATDADGNTYLTSIDGRRIRKIDTRGRITTVAEFGLVVDGPATTMVVDTPVSVAVDPAGTAYVAGDTPLMAVTTDGKVHQMTDIPYDDRREVGSLAAGTDGSVYQISNRRVDRIYPDGVVVTVAGGAAAPSGKTRVTRDVDGKRATTVVLDPSDVAIGPSGELYLASGTTVYRLNRDDTLKTIVDMTGVDGYEETENVGDLSIAVSRGGDIYVVAGLSDRVFAVNRSGQVRVFAGNGSDSTYEDNGDGDDATDAPMASPTDVAVAADGTVYIATDDGVRRVSTDGEIDTVVQPLTNGEDLGGEPESLALDGQGNLYLTAVERNRLYVVVRPGELPQPFPWGLVWLGIGVVALVAVAYGVIRYRRNPRPARPVHTTPLLGDPKRAGPAEPADPPEAADPDDPTDPAGSK